MNSIFKSTEQKFREFDSLHKRERVYQRCYVRRSNRIANRNNPLRVYKRMGSYQKVRKKNRSYELYVLCKKTSCNMQCERMNAQLKRFYRSKKKQDEEDFLDIFTNVCDRNDNQSLIEEVLFNISKKIRGDDLIFFF